jgi:hypothetical protein
VDAVDETSESDSLTRVAKIVFVEDADAVALAFCTRFAVAVAEADAETSAEDVDKTPSTPKSSELYAPYP